MKTIFSCILLCLGTLFSAAALAQAYTLRNIPADAPRATMSLAGERALKINTRVYALTPGAQIRSANNTLVMTSMLEGEQYDVRLQFTPQGQIHRVWILNEAELAVNAPRLPDDSIWRRLFPWLYDDTVAAPAE